MSTGANRLYKWMTEEMTVLPFNEDSKGKIPITVANLEFLVQGPGEKLWEHMGKHVYSFKKVDKIRKNLLISRLKGVKVEGEIPKNDYVGKKLKMLQELRHIRSSLDKSRKEIKDIEEKCKQLNTTHKVKECNRQFLKSQSDDLKRRVLLLQMAEDTIASKVKICRSSDNYFDRFKSFEAKDLDSSNKPSFVKTSESSSMSHFPFCENDEDSDVRSRAGCLNFLGKCTAITKDIVEEKYNHILIEVPSKSIHLDSFSLIHHRNLTSTPSKARDSAVQKFEAKKKEMRKYVSEKILHMQPELVHGLLLTQTSKGITSLAECHTHGRFTNELRFLGTNDNTKILKAELDKKFNDLYYEITSNFISSARERNIASRVEQTLNSLMAQVETELKEIFTIQAAMVEKVYDLVKIETQIATLSGECSHIKESLTEMNSDLSYYSDGLKQLHMPDEAQLLKSLEILKNFRESTYKMVLRNHSEFFRFMREMKGPDFLRGLGPFCFERGLISQEIMPFTSYPLDYHLKTNVCGKLIPNFKLLSNGFHWQNLVSLGVSGDDDAIFDLCIKATMGNLPQCSPETILLAAFKSKLYCHEVDAAKVAKICMNDQILLSAFSRAQDLSSKFHKNEELLAEEIQDSKDTARSSYKGINSILGEVEFLLNKLSENAISECVPKSITYEGKNYQQWHLEYLAALHKMKNEC